LIQSDTVVAAEVNDDSGDYCKAGRIVPA